MNRQVILDTETTGLRTEEGHRIIEIGCVEMIDRKLTGKHYHQYINPEREIDAGAFAIHGISNHFLKDQPTFKLIAQALMDFISGAELIIHNAPFDIGFINHELLLLQSTWKNVLDYCQVVDTLSIARKRHVGQRNNLDALCKRYHVDNSKRELHGALMDAHLLAQVYLAMTGGQGSFFDGVSLSQNQDIKQSKVVENVAINEHEIIVVRASEQELIEHEEYLKLLKQLGHCLWLDEV